MDKMHDSSESSVRSGRHPFCGVLAGLPDLAGRSPLSTCSRRPDASSLSGTTLEFVAGMLSEDGAAHRSTYSKNEQWRGMDQLLHDGACFGDTEGDRLKWGSPAQSESVALTGSPSSRLLATGQGMEGLQDLALRESSGMTAKGRVRLHPRRS